MEKALSAFVKNAGSFEIWRIGMPWGWSLASGIIGVVLDFFILTSQQFGEFALVLTVGSYVIAYGIISIAEYFYFRHYCQLTQAK